MTATERKRYYNRVRRTCIKYDIAMKYDGAPLARAVYAIELIDKDGNVLASDSVDHSQGGIPASLIINWKDLHEKLLAHGFKGGIQ